MFDYLQKFKTLPPQLREVVSNDDAAKKIAGLEKKYGIGLDALVIKIMTKDVAWQAVSDVLESEHNLQPQQARALQDELAREVFAPVTRYLGIRALNPAADTQTASTTPSAAKTSDKPAGETKEEAAELQTMKQKAQRLQASAPVDGGNAEAATRDDVLQAAGVAAGSDEARRLERIAHTFYKGIRDAIDTKETLKKATEAGGLGLDETRAQAVIAALQRHNGGKDEAQQLRPAPPKTPLAVDEVRDVEYSFPQEPKTAAHNAKPQQSAAKPEPPQDAPAYRQFTEDELDHELAPPPAPSAAKQTTNSRPVAKQAPAKKQPFHISTADVDQAQKALGEEGKTHTSAAAPEKQPVSVRVQRSQPHDDRPRVRDVVRPQKRAQGPLDELSGMDVASFRRLGTDASAQAAKLQQMIAVMEHEGVQQRQAAVAAWRTSPLYTQYVRLGQRSFTEGRPVEEVVSEEKKANGETVLTPAEFNAILELNRALRV